jgi:hypothetical protein
MSLRPGTGSPPSQNLNARLNDGRRVLDVADLRQYIYEQMGRIRTTVLMIDDRSATTMATARTLPITVVTTTLPQQEPGKKEERNAGQPRDSIARPRLLYRQAISIEGDRA